MTETEKEKPKISIYDSLIKGCKIITIHERIKHIGTPIEFGIHLSGVTSGLMEELDVLRLIVGKDYMKGMETHVRQMRHQLDKNSIGRINKSDKNNPFNLLAQLIPDIPSGVIITNESYEDFKKIFDIKYQEFELVKNEFLENYEDLAQSDHDLIIAEFSRTILNSWAEEYLEVTKSTFQSQDDAQEFINKQRENLELNPNSVIVKQFVIQTPIKDAKKPKKNRIQTTKNIKKESLENYYIDSYEIFVIDDKTLKEEFQDSVVQMAEELTYPEKDQISPHYSVKLTLGELPNTKQVLAEHKIREKRVISEITKTQIEELGDKFEKTESASAEEIIGEINKQMRIEFYSMLNIQLSNIIDQFNEDKKLSRRKFNALLGKKSSRDEYSKQGLIDTLTAIGLPEFTPYLNRITASVDALLQTIASDKYETIKHLLSEDIDDLTIIRNEVRLKLSSKLIGKAALRTSRKLVI